jgi:hypothetical protein
MLLGSYFVRGDLAVQIAKRIEQEGNNPDARRCPWRKDNIITYLVGKDDESDDDFSASSMPSPNSNTSPSHDQLTRSLNQHHPWGFFVDAEIEASVMALPPAQRLAIMKEFAEDER